jgi:hypothetical protein
MSVGEKGYGGEAAKFPSLSGWKIASRILWRRGGYFGPTRFFVIFGE